MRRNGTFFISIVAHKQLVPSIWDPYSYRKNGLGECLGDYVTTSEPTKPQDTAHISPFCPIEYRHIPKGKYLSFMLEFSQDNAKSTWPVVGEEQLLFGTLRAYIGNVLVTPRAEWLNLASPLFFPVKSEFVCLIPRDDLHYFWWAYLRSDSFRRHLPLGGGGTRPRLDKKALMQTPVKVPDIDTRRSIHERLKNCAMREWKQYAEKLEILNSISL